MASVATEEDVRRRTAIADYRKKLLQHRELESRNRKVKENLRGAKEEFAKTEEDLKSLQSVGQIIGEVLKPLDNESVDPVVYNMLHEDPGNVSYSTVGGLSDQILEMRESIELPLMNPELFLRVGIKPPKGVLLYGHPGTGKTLLARAITSNIDANFLKECCF